jgi:redox-sensitive bicupin YhaK (pirin superfamily)
MTQPDLRQPAARLVRLDQLAYVERPFSRGHAHLRFPGMKPGDDGFLDFGVLELCAIERIDAGEGFAMHRHENVEIVTLCLRGSFVHEDSLGGGGRFGVDEVAVHSAGTGISHAERASEDGELLGLQIWLTPKTRDDEPAFALGRFPRAARRDRLVTFASGRTPTGRGALALRADADVAGAALSPGTTVVHPLEPGRVAYVVIATGEAEVAGLAAAAGERALVRARGPVVIRASRDADVVVIDMPG